MGKVLPFVVRSFDMGERPDLVRLGQWHTVETPDGRARVKIVGIEVLRMPNGDRYRFTGEMALIGGEVEIEVYEGLYEPNRCP